MRIQVYIKFQLFRRPKNGDAEAITQLFGKKVGGNGLVDGAFSCALNMAI